MKLFTGEAWNIPLALLLFGGAIIRSGTGTAAEKMKALNVAAIRGVQSPADSGQALSIS